MQNQSFYQGIGSTTFCVDGNTKCEDCVNPQKWTMHVENLHHIDRIDRQAALVTSLRMATGLTMPLQVQVEVIGPPAQLEVRVRGSKALCAAPCLLSSCRALCSQLALILCVTCLCVIAAGSV